MSSNPLHNIDIKNVKNALNQRGEKLVAGLGKYRCLMEMFHKTNVSEDRNFQRCYNGFFRMQRRSPEFYTEYFRFMERHKSEADLTFDRVLKHLYAKTEKVEPSFSSKMLSMINQNKPVWDRFVLKNLKLRFSYNGLPEKKISSAIAVYDEICTSFKDFVKSEQAKEWIKLFDKQFPEAEGISVVKKIDLILWQMRD